jgi:hypothetical protein
VRAGGHDLSMTSHLLHSGSRRKRVTLLLRQVMEAG